MQYINEEITSWTIYINNYVEKIVFRVMNLHTIDVRVGYLSIDWVHHSTTFTLSDLTHFIQKYVRRQVPPV